jgi:protein-tyrosine phosphatase
MNKGGKVLVHCFAGVSRSATIVIAYMMQEHGMNYHSAFKFVKSKRPFINPNEGFRTQLITFGKELADKKAEQIYF